jgi:hypothetical protein
MPCPEFEDRLMDYAELAGDARSRVDAHVSACADCREFLEALSTVDAGLTAQLRGSPPVSAAFASAVRQRVRLETRLARPSLVPELLDLVGWGRRRTAGPVGLVVQPGASGHERGRGPHDAGGLGCRRSFHAVCGLCRTPFLRRFETLKPAVAKARLCYVR